MTFRNKLLSAAALLAVPALAGAQPTPNAAAQPVPAATPPAQTAPAQTSMDNVNQTVEEAQDSAAPPAGQPVVDEQPRQQAEPAEQPANPAQQPVDTATDAADTATEAAQDATTGTATTGAQTQTSAQGAAATPAGAVTAATAADVRTGVMVHDTSGGMVGTVETVDADSAIVSTGTVRADIPISSFGKNGQGLVLAMTRAQLEAAAQARTPSS